VALTNPALSTLDLLGLAREEDPRGREDLDPGHLAGGGIGGAGPLGDPAGDRPLARRTGLDEAAAAVRDQCRGLGEEQTLLRGDQRHAPAAGFLDEVLVVLGRLETEQRQAEAVLAAALAVAAAAVAAVFGEHRDDVDGEVERRVGAEPFDDEGHAGVGTAFEVDDDLAAAVGGGDDHPAWRHGGQPRRLDGVGDGAGHVADGGPARRGQRRDDELPPPLGADDRDGRAVGATGRDIEDRHPRRWGLAWAVGAADGRCRNHQSDREQGAATQRLWHGPTPPQAGSTNRTDRQVSPSPDRIAKTGWKRPL